MAPKTKRGRTQVLAKGK